jgi:hypothetical protein
VNLHDNGNMNFPGDFPEMNTCFILDQALQHSDEVMSTAETPQLPIKLRLKREAASKLSEKEFEVEANEPSAPRPKEREPRTAEQRTYNQQISREPCFSKISGIAVKTKPRTGPAFQAHIPELSSGGSKGRTG